MTMWHYMAAFEVVQWQPLGVTACHRGRFEVSSDEIENKKEEKKNTIQSNKEVMVLWFLWVWRMRERCTSIEWWRDGGLERIGWIGSFCGTLNLLMALLTMAPLTISVSWSAVFIPYLYIGPSLGWEGVMVWGRTQGMGFSGNSTPDFSDNTRVPWASPPCIGFNSNKGLVATGASLSGEIMLSVSVRLQGKENVWLPPNWKRSSPSGNVFGVKQIRHDLNFWADLFSRGFLNDLLCLMEGSRLYPGTSDTTSCVVFGGESVRQVYLVQQSCVQWIFRGFNLTLALHSGESSSITVRRSSQPHSYFNHQPHTMGRCVTARQWL